MGSGGIIPFIRTSVGMEVSDKLHDPAALPVGKEDPVLMSREARWCACTETCRSYVFNTHM